jgi:hypothetical protein
MKRWGLSYAGKELEAIENLDKNSVKGLRELINLSVELLQLANENGIDENKIIEMLKNAIEQIEILKKYDIDKDLQQTIFTMGLYAHLKLKKEDN